MRSKEEIVRAYQQQLNAQAMGTQQLDEKRVREYWDKLSQDEQKMFGNIEAFQAGVKQPRQKS